MNQDKLEIQCFSLLKEQAGTKRDQETVDASTNRIKSLLFKVKLGLSIKSIGLRWYYWFCHNHTFSMSGEISSNEWLLRSESLWNCMWKAGCILWTWLWWSLVWMNISFYINVWQCDNVIHKASFLFQGCSRWCCHC